MMQKSGILSELGSWATRQISASRDESTFIRHIGSHRKNLSKIVLENDIYEDVYSRCDGCRVKQPSLYTICQDKYLSYRYVKTLGFPIPGQIYYGQFDHFPGQIPGNCVVKACHGHSVNRVYCISEGIDVVRNIPVTRELLSNVFENQYVIIEELVEDKYRGGLMPLDYKVYVFDGVPEYLCIIERSNNGIIKKKAHAWFDFNTLEARPPVFHYPGRISDGASLVPDKSEMALLGAFCSKLQRDFKKVFIRADFYIGHEGVVFGEFTPQPSGGLGMKREAARQFDRLMAGHQIGLANSG